MGIMKPVFSSVFGPTIPDVNWIPNSLFALAEPGAWYDPSDLTTLFQDNLGVTPVTAPAQTVGLMLDKSQGLVLGSELVTNGDFASGTGWTLSPGWVISGGAATFTATGANAAIQQTGSTSSAAGRTYILTYNVTANSLNAGTLRVGGFSGGSFFGSGAITIPSSVGPQTARVLVSAPSGAGTVFDFWINNAATSGSITIDNISIKRLAGNHATQATLAQRPTYQIDSSGRPYLSFDGVDDGMVTGTITPATNKVQVFAGVRKLSDALRGVVAEMSATIAGNAGVFTLINSSSSGPNYTFSSKGTVQTDNTVSTYTAPITNVVSALGDISGPSSLVRVNGFQVGSVLTTQGTGNYLAYPLYIGRRGGSSLPFNGRIYSLIVRFGGNLTTQQITSAETYVNGKTGAY